MPLRTIRWAEPGDIKRCASLAKHYAKHWGPEATLEGFMRWLGEHADGYNWEED